MSGLGLFDFTVRFNKIKKVKQVSYRATEANPFREIGEISGYEIHCGELLGGMDSAPLFTSEQGSDGAFMAQPFVFGTFIHDLFKNGLFTRAVVNELRERKGLSPLQTPLVDFESQTDRQCDELASVFVAF